MALLAGMSVNYYTRLAQGHGHHVSDAVLDALAREPSHPCPVRVQPGRPLNLARHVFLEPSTRDLMTDWDREALNVAATLRVATGGHADDPRLAELIGELSIKSPEFVRIWATYAVKSAATG
jgi:transcription regulator MmyB-like protein